MTSFYLIGGKIYTGYVLRCGTVPVLEYPLIVSSESMFVGVLDLDLDASDFSSSAVLVPFAFYRNHKHLNCHFDCLARSRANSPQLSILGCLYFCVFNNFYSLLERPLVCDLSISICLFQQEASVWVVENRVARLTIFF